MSLRTLYGHLAHAILTLVFALAATPAFAYPQVGLSFYPAYAKPGDTVTLQLALSDSFYQLVGASIASFDFSPFTYTGGPISNGCGGTASASGSTMSLSGAGWAYTYPPCTLGIPVTYAGPPGTISVTFPIGGFVNSTAGSNPFAAAASFCAQPPTEVSNTADSGPGSLRDVLETVSAGCSAGYTITFNIPGPGPHVIRPASPLPPLVPVPGYSSYATIDGTSQPPADGAIRIELDGSLCSPSCTGLVLGSGGTLSGMAIHSFASYGVEVNGSASISSFHIGLDAGGSGGTGNGLAGIHIPFGSYLSLIRGNGTLVANNGIGVLVEGSANVYSGVEFGRAKDASARGNGTGISFGAGASGSVSDLVVAHSSAGAGINVDPAAQNIYLARNSTFGNKLGGIANARQAYPVFTARYDGVNTIITGSLAEPAGASVKLEFFSNSVAGVREGETYISAANPAIDAAGNFASVTLAGFHDNISATSSVDKCGEACYATSEYSPAVAVTIPAPSLRLSATSLTFSAALAGTSSAPVTLVLTNVGTVALNFAATPFVVTGDFAIRATTCGLTLGADTSCTLDLVFSPTAAGDRDSSLAIFSDAPGSPQTVSLIGRGANPPTIQIVTAATPVAGTTTSVTVQVGNSSVYVDFSGFAGSLTYPPGYVNTAAPAPRGTCGAAVTAIVGGNVVMANAGTVVKNTVCDLMTADVVVPAAGSYAFNIPAGAISMTTPFAWSNPAPITFTVNVVTPATPILAVSPSTLTFPATPAGLASATQNVTITNGGAVNVAIGAAAVTSGPFASAGTCVGTLAPSASCTMTLKFLPTATGPVAGTFSVTSNAAGSPHVVALSGTGAPPLVPGIAVSGSSLTFANRTLATTSPPQSVAVTNTGTAPLAVTGITVSGDYAFTSTCAALLAPGAGCTVSVTFTPLITGTRLGNLSIATNAPGSPTLVSLSGVGVDVPVGTLDISPSQLDFVAQPLNVSSAAQLVSVTNVGSATVFILDIRLTGDFAFEDVAAPARACGGPLAPAATCVLAVTFRPTAAGNRFGSLRIASDGTNFSAEVGLGGFGVAIVPQRALALPAALDFGPQPFGTRSAGQIVALTNNAAQAIVVSDIEATGDFSVSESCSAIPAHGSCVATVFFTPSARGSRAGTLTVRILSETLPYVVTLSGEGAPNPVPLLSVTPTRIGFGNAFVGTISAPATVTLSNIGEARLLVDGFTAPGDFTVESHCGSSIEAGSSCGVDVRFFARMLDKRGGLLEIHSNAAGSPHYVDLSGTGCSIPNVGRSRIPQLLCGP